MEKIIHAHIYTPHNAIFKSMRNDRAKCTTITCNNFDNCELYKRGECSWRAALGWHACPYGKHHEEEGFTSKAKAYHNWISERKKRYADCLDKLNSTKDVIAYVGEYVFLPYSHMTMIDRIPFLAKSTFFGKDNCFLKKEDFTIENVKILCEAAPQAMMGGIIKSYQDEVVPKFIKHLAEKKPDIYRQLCDIYEPAKKILENYSYIGREAILQTITPNIGKLIDCHKAEWTWDGEWLISMNSHASFMLINKFSELRIRPIGDEKIKITDNAQVNDNTVLID